MKARAIQPPPGGVRVAVIIATLNPGVAQLQRCLESVWAQSHRPVEVLVIDGGSTDGTPQYLDAAGPRLAYWRSAPDAGLYDAWNHGMTMTTADWMCFLGADDRFAGDTALAQLLGAGMETGAALVTGRGALVADGRVRGLIGRRWNWLGMRYYQHVVHIGALHHRSLFESFGAFSTRYPISGDYEFLLRLPRSARVAFVDRTVVDIGCEGMSRRDPMRVHREALAIHRERPEIPAPAAYAMFGMRCMKTALRALLR